MTNKHCCKILIFVLLVFVSVNLQAQRPQYDSLLQNAEMKRHKFNLAMNLSSIDEYANLLILGKDRLRTMLSETQFKSYRMARNCYYASLPFLYLGGGLIVFWTGAILFQESNFDKAILTMIFLPSSIVLLLPGTILNLCSKQILEDISADYNLHRKTAHFPNGVHLHLGIVDEGVGLKLSF